jgi:hypothetical protein
MSRVPGGHLDTPPATVANSEFLDDLSPAPCSGNVTIASIVNGWCALMMRIASREAPIFSVRRLRRSKRLTEKNQYPRDESAMIIRRPGNDKTSLTNATRRAPVTGVVTSRTMPGQRRNALRLLRPTCFFSL